MIMTLPLNLRTIFSKLQPASEKWFELGLEFKLETHILENIRTSNRNQRDCLRECIKIYLQTTSPRWQDIVVALKHQNVGFCALAEEIETVIGQPTSMKHCSTKILICFSVYTSLITVIIILVVLHNNRLDDQVKASISEFDNLYSPNDSRLLSASTILYDKVQFNSVGMHTSLSIFIYLVDSNGSNSCKKSTDTEISVIENGFTVYPNAYTQWNYYLYPTSSINGTICSYNSGLMAYIIKGKNNLRLLEDAPVRQFIKYVEKDYTVTVCPEMISLDYNVSEEEYYYVMIANFGRSKNTNKFNINVTFERCQHRNTSIPLCVITPYQECSIPLNYSYSGEDVKFLVTTSDSSDCLCRRELLKVVVRYHYRIYFFVVFFVVVFCLVELFHAFPQFRYYTVGALIVVIGFPVGTETDILPPSFYIDALK